MSEWKPVLIPLICGLITVGIACINIYAGVLAAPIMYSVSKNLLSP